MEDCAVLDFRCTHRSQSTPRKLHSPSSINLNCISRVFVLTSISTANPGSRTVHTSNLMSNSLMSKYLIICWTPSTPLLWSGHRLDAGYCLLGGRARQRAVDIPSPPSLLYRALLAFFFFNAVCFSPASPVIPPPATRALDIFC